jgi:hypothetical protein
MWRATARPEARLRTIILALETARIIRPLRIGAPARIAAAVRRLPEARCWRALDLLGRSACGRAFVPALDRRISALNAALRRLAVILARRWILTLESALRRPLAAFERTLHRRLALHSTALRGLTFKLTRRRIFSAADLGLTAWSGPGIARLRAKRPLNGNVAPGLNGAAPGRRLAALLWRRLALLLLLLLLLPAGILLLGILRLELRQLQTPLAGTRVRRQRCSTSESAGSKNCGGQGRQDQRAHESRILKRHLIVCCWLNMALL